MLNKQNANLDSEGNLLPLFEYPTIEIMLARFICAIVLHMKLQNELLTGLANMKLVLNHKYRFENPGIAFAAGFLQAFSIFMLETINFLVILQSYD
jgi:hypothetical protein